MTMYVELVRIVLGTNGNVGCMFVEKEGNIGDRRVNLRKILPLSLQFRFLYHIRRMWISVLTKGSMTLIGFNTSSSILPLPSFHHLSD